MTNGQGPKRPVRPRHRGVGGRRRRVIIAWGAARPRLDDRRSREQRAGAPPKPPREIVPPTGPASVPSGVTVRDFSQALGVPAAQIIKILMALGDMKQITASLTDEEVQLIATELRRGGPAKPPEGEEPGPGAFEDDPADLADRPPVVTMMGHVDHGK